MRGENNCCFLIRDTKRKRTHAKTLWVPFRGAWDKYSNKFMGDIRRNEIPIEQLDRLYGKPNALVANPPPYGKPNALVANPPPSGKSNAFMANPPPYGKPNALVANPPPSGKSNALVANPPPYSTPSMHLFSHCPNSKHKTNHMTCLHCNCTTSQPP